MNESDKQFLAEEERLFEAWRRADEAATAAEQAAKAKMDRHVLGGPLELTLDECYEVLRLRSLAAKAAAALITHSRSRPI